MIYMGIGANLPAEGYSGPKETLEAALEALQGGEVQVTRLSRWYRSKPIPASDQPWFVNAVAEVETSLSPLALLEEFHSVEAQFGRRRTVANAARPVDLDLLLYGDIVQPAPARPVLPHPRMTLRGFVLLPLRDLLPDWRDPFSSEPLVQLINKLPSDQVTEPFR